MKSGTARSVKLSSPLNILRTTADAPYVNCGSKTDGSNAIPPKSPALQIPMAYLYGLVTFSFVLSIFRYIQMMVLKHIPAEVEAAEGELTEEEKKALDEMEKREAEKGGTK